MNPLRRNVEIKAHCKDPAATRKLVEKAGAGLSGIEEQADIYYRVNDGRLKLRRIKGKHSELIRYKRADESGPKTSSYSIRRIRFPRVVHYWLALRHGLLVEVRKRREIWLWRGVRIHLDEVADLGIFLELEAVVEDIGDHGEAERRCRIMMEILAIGNDDLLSISYSDMLIRMRASPDRRR